MLRYRSISADHAAISQRSQKRLTQDKKRLGSLHLAYTAPKFYIGLKVFIHPAMGGNSMEQNIISNASNINPRNGGQ